MSLYDDMKAEHATPADALNAMRDGLRSMRDIPRCECGTCKGNAEPYCPAHRYRWEYAQDEQAAHDALDLLGAPRADPPPNDVILSVAGRITALAAHHQIPLVRRCRGCGYRCNHLAIICGGCGSALPVPS